MHSNNHLDNIMNQTVTGADNSSGQNYFGQIIE